MHAGIDLRDRRVRADVVDPVVVADVGLGRSGQREHRGSQSAGDEWWQTLTSSLLCPSLVLFEPWRESRGSDGLGAGVDLSFADLLV